MKKHKLAALLLVGTTAWAQAQHGATERNLTNHPAHDRHGSYSPDGQQVAFDSDRGASRDIYWMKTDGSGLRQLTFDSTDEQSPTWHPSGKKLLFESNQEGPSQLYLFDLAENRAEKISIPGLPSGDLKCGRLSPDGSQLAFTIHFPDTSSHLYLCELASKKYRQLTDGNSRCVYLDWSPDGKGLVLVARFDTTGNAYAIYTMALASGKMRQLGKATRHVYTPAWSPDGKCIAFAHSDKKRATELFVMKKNGRKMRHVTRNKEGEVLPFWHPGGKRMLVTAWRNGNYELCEFTLF